MRKGIEIRSIEDGETAVIDHVNKTVTCGGFSGDKWFLNKNCEQSGVKRIKTARYCSGRQEGEKPKFGYAFSHGEGNNTGRFATYYTFEGCNKNMVFPSENITAGVAVIHALHLVGYKALDVPYLNRINLE